MDRVTCNSCDLLSEIRIRSMKLHVLIVIAKLFIFCLVPASVSRVVHVMLAHVVLEDDDE